MMPQLFDDQSPFIVRDNRTRRPMLATTADLLNRRHEALLPQSVVEGRSVLDIGCALAATGKWALDRGATHYTGVEPQQEYAAIAAELLAADAKAEIVCERGMEFFAACDTRFDVVSLIGVLHGQYNFLGFLESACYLADQYVCIETQGNDASGAAMLPAEQTWMPLAGCDAGSTGFGWAVAPAALTILMRHLGFVPDMTPVYVDDELAHRYTMRYRRVAQRGVTSGDFANITYWKDLPLPPQAKLKKESTQLIDQWSRFAPDELTALARLDIEQGRVEQGLAKLKSLVSGSGGDAASLEALGMAARLYAQLGLFDRAEALFERFLASSPGAIEEAFQLGMVKYDKGQDGQALEIWEGILQSQPAFAPGLFFSALALSRQGRLADARRKLEVLLQTAPADNLYYERGRDLLQSIVQGGLPASPVFAPAYQR